jgi:hypothetical protein
MRVRELLDIKRCMRWSPESRDWACVGGAAMNDTTDGMSRAHRCVNTLMNVDMTDRLDATTTVEGLRSHHGAEVVPENQAMHTRHNTRGRFLFNRPKKKWTSGRAH